MFRSRRRASAELPPSAPPPSAARRKRARTRMSSRARRPVGLHTATHSLFVTLLHTCRTRRTTIFPTYVVNVILKCYMYFNNFSRCVRSPGNTWSWISWLKKNSVKETTESASTGARRVPTNDAVSEAPRGAHRGQVLEALATRPGCHSCDPRATGLSAAQCGPPLAKQHRLVELVGLGARAQPREHGVTLEHLLSSQEGPRRVEGARRGRLRAPRRVDEDLARHAPLRQA